MTSQRAQLRQLLDPWKTPSLDHPGGFRFHDAPPDVVRRALAAVEPFFRSSRPNGQPPADWLVDVGERLGGLLAGQVSDEAPSEHLRVNAMCVPGGRGAELARAVDQDWPDAVAGDAALDLSLAEAWESWDAAEPVWTGNGRELLEGPARAAVVGLWWD